MNLKLVLFAAILAAAAVHTGESLSSQDQPAAREVKPGEADSANELLIDTWVRYAMPGEQHKLLEKMAGSWSMTVKYRMNAETPAVESHGTCERKWILGKRFLLEEFDGGSLGLPFRGLAIYGYDAFEKKYTSVWIDTMSTAITRNFGTCQDSCQWIDFVGRHGDPWSGTVRSSRGCTRFVDEDHHVLELHEPDASGKEFKVLEIVYTRK